MIQITDRIWIGNSKDEQLLQFDNHPNIAILNVAQDLQGTKGWKNKIEYMQVGLIDGPGNEPVGYYTAVLALATLLKRSKVIVCCHSGSRSLAVVIMYRDVVAGHGWPGDWRPTWDGWYVRLCAETGVTLPVPHPAHRDAYDKLDWKLVSAILRE